MADSQYHIASDLAEHGSNSPSDWSISTQSKQKTCVATYRAYLRLGTYAKGAAACALGAPSGLTCAKMCHSKIVSQRQNLATLLGKIVQGHFVLLISTLYYRYTAIAKVKHR